MLKLCEVHSFFMCPHLCQCTIVLNADAAQLQIVTLHDNNITLVSDCSKVHYQFERGCHVSLNRLIG